MKLAEVKAGQNYMTCSVQVWRLFIFTHGEAMVQAMKNATLEKMKADSEKARA